MCNEGYSNESCFNDNLKLEVHQTGSSPATKNTLNLGGSQLSLRVMPLFIYLFNCNALRVKQVVYQAFADINT